MTWKYVAGDNYDLKQLKGIKDFFKSDFESATNEYIKSLNYRKWGLPNWRINHIRISMGMEEARTNLYTIIKVIEVIERENK